MNIAYNTTAQDGSGSWREGIAFDLVTYKWVWLTFQDVLILRANELN